VRGVAAKVKTILIDLHQNRDNPEEVEQICINAKHPAGDRRGQEIRLNLEFVACGWVEGQRSGFHRIYMSGIG
jgi:hypothetical protein